MIIVPDCCTLIYLTKAGLLNLLPELFDEVWISGVVYRECVTRGKQEGKDDAFILEKLLEESQSFKIKKTSYDNDFEKERSYFTGFGETDVYLTVKQNKNAIAITSDNRAYKKMQRRGVNVIKTDELMFLSFKRKILNFDDFCDSLSKLRWVGGTTDERIAFLIKKALNIEK